jgi:8-oxo-dGTP pyrophosphatase MutT (NUDIX family)
MRAHPSLLTAAAVAEPIRAVLERRPPLAGESPSRRAAVLIMLHDRDGAAHLTLTKRSDRLASHRGQVSLPGGGWEPDDPDLLATALRETSEEVGVEAVDIDVLGRLHDVETVATDYRVSPFVGRIVGVARPWARDTFEVARVMEIPLGDLMRADAALPPRPGIAELRYPLDGEDVWGATARILRDFAAVVRAALPDGRAELS